MKKLIVLSAVMLLGSASYGVSAHHCDTGSCDVSPLTIKGNAGWMYCDGDCGSPTLTPPWGDGALPEVGDGDCFTEDWTTGPEDGIEMTKTNGQGKTTVACKDLIDGQYDPA